MWVRWEKMCCWATTHASPCGKPHPWIKRFFDSVKREQAMNNARNRGTDLFDECGQMLIVPEENFRYVLSHIQHDWVGVTMAGPLTIVDQRIFIVTSCWQRKMSLANVREYFGQEVSISVMNWTRWPIPELLDGNGIRYGRSRLFMMLGMWSSVESFFRNFIDNGVSSSSCLPCSIFLEIFRTETCREIASTFSKFFEKWFFETKKKNAVSAL